MRTIPPRCSPFKKDKPDIAILDIELDDGIVFPLAQRLADEDIPIIFHSGRYSSDEVNARFPGAKTLTKPCPPARMIETVNSVLAAA